MSMREVGKKHMPIQLPRTHTIHTCTHTCIHIHSRMHMCALSYIRILIELYTTHEVVHIKDNTGHYCISLGASVKN